MSRKRGASAVSLRFIAVVVLCLFSASGHAQRRDNKTAQEYLSLNLDQRAVFAQRMSDSQSELIQSCLEQSDTARLAARFDQWLAENPGFLSRSVIVGFTAFLLDQCVRDDDVGETTRRKKLESGGWTLLPYIQNELQVDFYNDYVFRNSGEDGTFNDLFSEAKLNSNWFFARQLYIELGLALKPTGEEVEGDSTFENHGLYVGSAALTWDRDDFWISAGKGRVNFGVGANAAPGIWGGDILDDYVSVGGRLGVATTVNFGSQRVGQHSFYASIFTADTSWLSRPYFTAGEKLNKADCGPSNTGKLDSWSVAIDGTGIPGLGGMRYHLAALTQSVDCLLSDQGQPIPQAGVSNENRLAFALQWSGIALGDNAAIAPLVEYDFIENANGFDGREEVFMTASLLLTFAQWNLSVANTSWRIEQPGSRKSDNTQYQISAGYYFQSGITLEGGYRYLNEAGVTTHTLGLAFYYEFPFGS